MIPFPKNSALSIIPFRTLCAIGKTLGGGSLGFDANRVPGGKDGVAAKLDAMYGEKAIMAIYRRMNEQDAPQGTEQHAPRGESETQGERDNGDNGDAQGDADNKQGDNDNAKQGDSGDADSNGDAQGDKGARGDATDAPQGDDNGDAPQGEATPQDAPDMAQQYERGDNAPEIDQQDAQQTDAQGDADAQQDKMERGPTPENDAPPADCPAPDAAAPTPSGNPMDDHIRTIARQEAVKASAPIAEWINTELPRILDRVVALQGQHADAQQQGDAPEYSTRPPKQFKRKRGDAVQHRLFPKLLALMSQGVQVLLLGPAGTGKSHACRAAAEALGMQFADISLSSGASESNLTGWLLPTGDNGRFNYVASPFVTTYERDNSAFLFDEIDAASPDMLVVLNAALANGGFTLAQRFNAPQVKRGDNVCLLAAANTVDGADENYSARQQVDGATLNRFYVLRWDYDENLERAIVKLPARQTYWKGVEPDTSTAAQEYAIKWVHDVRAAAARGKVQRIVSVRMADQYISALAAGLSHKEIQTDLLCVWTRDEISRLGDLAPGKNHYLRNDPV